jgi:SAM-dependent methyltransferase
MADTKIDYGLDAPLTVKNMFGRAGWSLFFGFALWFMNHKEYPGPALSLLTVLGLLGLVFLGVALYMTWSSRTAKLALRERLLDAAGPHGDDKVLDVGCGRGLLLIGAAKRLQAKGRATGIDIWNPEALADNTSDATRENAKAEGVGDRIRVESGDARKIAYPDAAFDVVLSNLAIHNISGT